MAQSPSAAQLLQQGISDFESGKYEHGLTVLTHCIALAQTPSDGIILQKAYNNLGNIYSQTGKSELALRHYLLSLSIAKKRNDIPGMAKINKNIGAMYSEQKDFTVALAYYKKAMDLIGKDHKPIKADCLNNMGVVYEQQEKYTEALKAYSEALSIYKLVEDKPRIAMSLNNLAIVRKYLGKYEEAVQDYLQALSISEKTDDRFMVAATQNNLGNVYILIGDYQKSLQYCLLAYKTAEAIKAAEIAVESLDGIATAYEKLRNYPNAIAYRKKYEAAKGDFINSERSSQLAEMQVKYDTLDKEAKIRSLRQQSKIDALKIQKRNRLIILILAFLMIFIVILFFWRKNQQLKNVVARDKAIRDTEEQERIRMARDIHDDLGSGLSKVNFLSEIILQKSAQNPEIGQHAKSVQETAAKMIGNMRDLIWALNPDNTTLNNLLARIREYATDYLEDYQIKPHYSFPEAIPTDPIAKEIHRGIFMVVKESLNNISKYSGASNAYFNAIIDRGCLFISIKDDGDGFDVAGVTAGNGLPNMKKRLESVSGFIEITSGPGIGTEISLRIPMQQLLRN
ncbi:tetratricopeptide repeat-containing sensor histidine kinase [Flavobacterium pallidum]|uniref:tetratricopeptide repeat-containing sensor histidine kinase n=1 Tax=Flavobacterium pallidum TaxID=2172098 RepID=UPI0015E81405|nr:sensor histidine kinase [Flavobacterium pallidum]